MGKYSGYFSQGEYDVMESFLQHTQLKEREEKSSVIELDRPLRPGTLHTPHQHTLYPTFDLLEPDHCYLQRGDHC